MKKLISIFILAVFFLSFASAVNSYGYWTVDDTSDTYTIMAGEDAEFGAIIGTANPSMTVDITLYNSGMILLNRFENGLVVNGYSHEETYTVLSSMYNIPGTYYIQISAEDNDNDVDVYELTLIVEEEDVNAPLVSISNPVANEYYNSNAFDVVYSAADPENNLQFCWYSLDGGVTNYPLGDCDGAINNLQVSEGSNTLTIYADDDAGNIGSDSVTFNVDTVDPELSISYPLGGETYNLEMISLQYSASDLNLDSCKYSLDGGETITDLADCSGNINGLQAIEGSNHWIVYVADLAGNTAMAEVIFNVDTSIADTTAPVVTIISPENGEEYDDEIVEFTYTVIDENLESCWLVKDQSVIEFSDCEGSVNLEAQEGTNVWTLYGRDEAGNVGSATVTFYIDTSSDDDDDDDDDNEGYKRLYFYETTYEDDLYFKQFEPKTITLGEDDLTVSDDEQSWFGKLWKAIIDFFKGLFGF